MQNVEREMKPWLDDVSQLIIFRAPNTCTMANQPAKAASSEGRGFLVSVVEGYRGIRSRNALTQVSEFCP